MTRRFPAPWIVETIPGSFKVMDATSQALAYIYCRSSPENADAAKALTPDEARRIAANVAKLPDEDKARMDARAAIAGHGKTVGTLFCKKQVGQ